MKPCKYLHEIIFEFVCIYTVYMRKFRTNIKRNAWICVFVEH